MTAPSRRISPLMNKAVHTCPVLIRHNNEMLERLLESRGYSRSPLGIKGSCIFCIGDKYFTGTDTFAETFERSRKAADKSFQGFIDCKDDDALFMMLAALRRDRNDTYQVFVNESDGFTDVCMNVRWTAKGWHKMSAKEILQRFRPSLLPEWMKEEEVS